MDVEVPARSFQFPSHACTGPRIFRGREQTPAKPDPMRKENFNEATRAKAGSLFYFRLGSTHYIVFEALPRDKRTLRVSGHEY